MMATEYFYHIENRTLHRHVAKEYQKEYMLFNSDEPPGTHGHVIYVDWADGTTDVRWYETFETAGERVKEILVQQGYRMFSHARVTLPQ